MSHGPSSGGDTIEPNLTPLLDLVLQLLMLFMICGNFASESNDPVELARSSTAKRLSDSDNLQADPNKEEDFLFITVKPYQGADGVLKAAKAAIDNRENIIGTNPDPNIAKDGFSHELAAHYRKILESDADSIYNRLKNHELLSAEQSDLLKQLHVSNNERDLGDRFADDVRNTKMANFKDGDSYVIVPGTPARAGAAMKPVELKKWLDDQQEYLVAQHKDPAKTSVVIRPDGNMDYAVVYQILLLCQEAHFTNLKVRAIVPTTN